ncbi:MAG TPA: peptide deformylase [Chlamydiales bacterium]|nr:peptide deformylase [Chlamydiales bacterium]
MKLPLHYYGDPILRARCEEIEKITPDIVQLAEDMIETMITYNGVGIAAPQIGKLLRIYIFRNEWQNDKEEFELGPPQVVINPILSSPSKEKEEMVEGCLSLPGVQVNVRRPQKIHIRYQNLHGGYVEMDLEGFAARVNMHENDHLNGVLHIDRSDPKDRSQIEAMLRKMKEKNLI